VGLLRNTLILAATLAACDPDAPAADDRPVTDQTLTALTTDVAQLRVFDRMLRPIGLKMLPADQVVDAAVAQIQDRLKLDLVDPGCLALTPNADGLTLRFDACDYAANNLVDGQLRLRVEPESGECDGAPCILAIRYTLEIDALALGDTEITSARSTLRIPTDKSPRVYHGEAELIGPNGDSLSTRTESSWTSAAGCFTADFGLEIATDTREISAAGRDVHVCEANCPDSGEGLIAWGAGSTLAWRYTGKGTLQVRGPKGRVFTVTQACADK
jgi:hypothetical protein